MKSNSLGFVFISLAELSKPVIWNYSVAELVEATE